MRVPAARLRPDGLAEHVEAVVVRSKHRVKSITTNDVTRSGWFAPLLVTVPMALFALWAVYSFLTEPWFM